jgi:hypothetical protein
VGSVPDASDDNIPLLPGVLVLRPRSADHVATDRFVRVFLCAWHRIPDDDRGILATYLRTLHRVVNWPGVSEQFMTSPYVVVEPAFRAGAAAAYWTGGDPAYLTFDSASVNTMPDDVLEVLVAHELAHAFLEGRGLPNDESAARSAVTRWGLDEAHLDQWLRSTDGRRVARGVVRQIARQVEGKG